MLLGFVAIILPILLTLTSRFRPQRIVFGTHYLLNRTIRRQSTAKRYLDWLQMILRCVMIGLLVLAVSRPFLRTGPETPFPSPDFNATTYIVAIDTSLSMQCRPNVGGPSWFETAIEQAKEYCNAVDPNSRVFLAKMGHQNSRVAVGQDMSPTDAVRALSNWQPTYSGLNLYDAFAQINALIDKIERDGRTAQTLIFSDFQSTDWAAWLDTKKTRSDPLLALDDSNSSQPIQVNGSYRLYPVTSQPLSNAAVASVAFPGLQAVVGESLPVTVTIRQFSNGDVKLPQDALSQVLLPEDSPEGSTMRAITLRVDGNSVASQTFSLEGNATSTIEMAWTPSRAGHHQLEFVLDDDVLLADNSFFQTVQVRNSLRFAIFDSGDRAGKFLQLALESWADTNQQSLRIERIPIQQWEAYPLQNADLVWMLGLPQANELSVAKLRELEVRRTPLIVFVGSETTSENVATWMRQFEVSQTTDAKPSIRNAQFPIRVAGSDYEAKRWQNLGLEDLTIDRYWKLETTLEEVVVGLTVDRDSPFLFQPANLQNHVTVVLTSVFDEWSSMAVWPGFIPLLDEILNVAFGAAQNRTLLVGQSIDLADWIATPSDTRQVTVLRPGENETEDWLLKTPDDTLASLALDSSTTERSSGNQLFLDRPGHYQFTTGQLKPGQFTSGHFTSGQSNGDGVETRPDATLCAVNVDVKQSDLRQIDVVNERESETQHANALPNHFPKDRDRIARWLLAALIAFTCFEFLTHLWVRGT